MQRVFGWGDGFIGSDYLAEYVGSFEDFEDQRFSYFAKYVCNKWNHGPGHSSRAQLRKHKMRIMVNPTTVSSDQLHFFKDGPKVDFERRFTCVTTMSEHPM